MKLQKYPMDTQMCPMMFESCKYGIWGRGRWSLVGSFHVTRMLPEVVATVMLPKKNIKNNHPVPLCCYVLSDATLFFGGVHGACAACKAGSCVLWACVLFDRKSIMANDLCFSCCPLKLWIWACSTMALYSTVRTFKTTWPCFAGRHIANPSLNFVLDGQILDWWLRHRCFAQHAKAQNEQKGSQRRLPFPNESDNFDSILQTYWYFST